MHRVSANATAEFGMKPDPDNYSTTATLTGSLDSNGDLKTTSHILVKDKIGGVIEEDNHEEVCKRK